VCNLGSIALPKFVEKGKFDHQKLFEVTVELTRNLNRVIDQNYYPVPEARRSNMRHRPIGIGVQGLADAFILMRHPFESVEAKVLNREIFETIYYAALTASKDIAKEDGPYETYAGQPRQQRHPAVRHVEREAQRPLGMGHPARRDQAARHAQQPAGGAHAHGQHRADPGQQRVLRAIHQQPLHAARAQRRIHRGEQVPAARPGEARPLERGDEEQDHPRPTAVCSTSRRSRRT
jgi:ribonucleotide reductase alpha subunit